MVKAMAQYFVGNFTFFICISWMFPYLVQRYSLTPSQAAKYSMVPLLSGATANWVSGFFVDTFCIAHAVGRGRGACQRRRDFFWRLAAYTL
jgi:hypothetical protein